MRILPALEAIIAALSLLAWINPTNAQVAEPPAVPTTANQEKPKQPDKTVLPSLPGFQDVKWGSTKQDARTILKAKGGEFDSLTDRYMPRLLNVKKGITVAGLQPDQILLSFGDEGLSKVQVFIECPTESPVPTPNYTITAYNNLFGNH